MILKNPTKEEVSIVIKGIAYSVAPESTVEVPNEEGKIWANTHKFLKVAEEVSSVDLQAEVAEINASEADAPIVDASDAQVPGDDLIPQE